MICNCSMAGTSACNNCPTKQWTDEGRFPSNVFFSYGVDAVEVVRCKDCKHRIVNDHYGEKGYLKIKAICELDTGNPFELGRCACEDDWFCCDGERKDEVGE